MERSFSRVFRAVARVFGRLKTAETALLGWLYLAGAMRVVVVGRSMEPALREGDRLLVSRSFLWLWRGRPRRGQIVFLRAGVGGAANPECIKRIVGLPHERVSVEAGRVTVNGERLDEPYLRRAASVAERAMLARAMDLSPSAEFTLGPDQYVVLGDNRPRSTDSRNYGPVRRADLLGVAVYRYAPAGRRSRLAR